MLANFSLPRADYLICSLRGVGRSLALVTWRRTTRTKLSGEKGHGLLENFRCLRVPRVERDRHVKMAPGHGVAFLLALLRSLNCILTARKQVIEWFQAGC